ncbi:MAG: GGDEF domain-containing protein [Candidatus Omnitrophica bacterium]|nr:GGDEF domain-containing protein [Candidatus Omnitrophota bacterium]
MMAFGVVQFAGLAFLGGLILFEYRALKRLVCDKISSADEDIRCRSTERERLQEEHNILKNENQSLVKQLDTIIGLYDLTREMCTYLDADKIFDYFSDKVRLYIDLKNCVFLKKDTIEKEEYRNYFVFPVTIGRKIEGYLMAEGIRDSDKEKCAILSQGFLLGMKRAILYGKIEELAITDSLTKVFTRRYWMDRFREEIDRSKRYHYGLSCLMIDIDHFKLINDQYGHMVGEVILSEVSRLIKENLRQIDLMGRYGGEEFSIVLSETGLDEARIVAERIRKAVEEKDICAYDEKLKATISIGISFFPGDADKGDELLNKADQALYKAKQSGRNQVRSYA